MFESLKKKLKNFFSTDTKAKKQSKKAVKKAKTKKKSKTAKKTPAKEEKLKKIADQITQEVPLKFEVGKLKYEPDEEAIKESNKIEEPVEEPDKKSQGFFARLTSRFTSSKLTEEQFNELFAELEIILLENNVALEVVDTIKANLAKQLINTEIKKDKMQQIVTQALKKSISDVLHEPPSLIEKIKNKQGPFVILFFGINGSGKTTSVAKLAHYLKTNSISCVMAAGDTFRAASIEQLETHSNRLGIPIVKSQYGSDPGAVAFDAIKYAQSHNIKVVLIDTAGRMYTRENLMKEMEKIVRVSKPDLKLFVGESITGNDATEQARMFNETAGIDGIILTKADVDDRGGTALSVSHVTQKPIYFLGMGQNYEDLKPFKKSIILEHLGLD